MLDELHALEDRALAELAQVSSEEELEAWRLNTMGRKGTMTTLLRNIGQLPAEVRPEAGREANRIRVALEQALATREEEIKRQTLAASVAQEGLDITLPGRPVNIGRLHVITKTLREILDIFGDMGFRVEEWREVESDEYNFQLLNIPPDHPARDMWSTFHTTQEGVLLRTHTSPGQVHAMRKYYPEPIRVILPGKCYRYEQVTARAEFMFHQVEGLAVGKNITMADLKGVLFNFARQMFGPDAQLRFRSSYFPFTEPSVEVDMDCILCDGKGCRICKYTGWLEILGAGMVHPTVLRNGGYDPDDLQRLCLWHGPGARGPAQVRHRRHPLFLRQRSALPGAVRLAG